MNRTVNVIDAQLCAECRLCSAFRRFGATSQGTADCSRELCDNHATLPTTNAKIYDTPEGK